ncbi:hypothetical protein D3C73_1431770 [compost metagenome]
MTSANSDLMKANIPASATASSTWFSCSRKFDQIPPKVCAISSDAPAASSPIALINNSISLRPSLPAVAMAMISSVVLPMAFASSLAAATERSLSWFISSACSLPLT